MELATIDGQSHRTQCDSGFSLVEVIVSMVLLATIAMAFLPLALRATTAAAAGTTLTTATRLAGEQLDALRAVTVASCPTGGDWTVVGTTSDPRGVELQTRTRMEGTCPGLVRYDVSVTRVGGSPVELASASTMVLVESS